MAAFSLTTPVANKRPADADDIGGPETKRVPSVMDMDYEDLEKVASEMLSCVNQLKLFKGTSAAKQRKINDLTEELKNVKAKFRARRLRFVESMPRSSRHSTLTPEKLSRIIERISRC